MDELFQYCFLVFISCASGFRSRRSRELVAQKAANCAVILSFIPSEVTSSSLAWLGGRTDRALCRARSTTREVLEGLLLHLIVPSDTFTHRPSSPTNGSNGTEFELSELKWQMGLLDARIRRL